MGVMVCGKGRKAIGGGEGPGLGYGDSYGDIGA